MKRILACLFLSTLSAAAEDLRTPDYYQVWFTHADYRTARLPGYAKPDEHSPKVAKFAFAYVLNAKKYVEDDQKRGWFLVTYAPGKTCYVRSNSDNLTKAHTEPCRPDAKGEYSARTLHHYFQVIDPDPNGLNGRVPPGPPLKGEDPMPNREVGTWPVSYHFKKGTILYGISNVWVGHLEDSQKHWWMNFRTPDDKDCWVRADSKHIQPVPGPDPTP